MRCDPQILKYDFNIEKVISLREPKLAFDSKEGTCISVGRGRGIQPTTERRKPPSTPRRTPALSSTQSADLPPQPLLGFARAALSRNSTEFGARESLTLGTTAAPLPPPSLTSQQREGPVTGVAEAERSEAAPEHGPQSSSVIKSASLFSSSCK